MKKSFLILFACCLFSLAACQSTQAISLPSPTVALPVVPTSTQIPITPTNTQTTNTYQAPKTPIPSKTATQRINLMAVGDIMLGRTIADLILEEGYQATFIYTADTLSKADITIGNLECPISDRGKPVQKNYVFRAPIESAKALSYAGFDILSVGNNHILDYGPAALIDTLDHLQSEKISTIGAGINAEQAYGPLYLEMNGLKLAFLSFVDVPTTDYDYLAWEAGPGKPGIAWAHEDQVRKGVTEANERADIVIVLLHNGFEFWQKVSDGQQEIAKLAIDSGASLVIGSHPHVLQRIEPYREGLIAYSMGNFVFDNFLFPPNYSAILSVELSPRGVESYELIQVVVQLNGVPEIMPYTIED
jgi:poly-gamma-glutamate synthesis protein (capsule biosynthesis protein)